MVSNDTHFLFLKLSVLAMTDRSRLHLISVKVTCFTVYAVFILCWAVLGTMLSQSVFHACFAAMLVGLLPSMAGNLGIREATMLPSADV
jgi:hypothetical protein